MVGEPFDGQISLRSWRMKIFRHDRSEMAKHGSHVQAGGELRKVLLLVICTNIFGLMGRRYLVQCSIKTESSSSCHFPGAASGILPYTVVHA